MEYREFARKLNIPNINFVPISALDGDNVVERSQRAPWYQGKTLMEILETAEVHKEKNLTNFRFPVQYKPPQPRFSRFCGTVAAGVVRVGDPYFGVAF